MRMVVVDIKADFLRFLVGLGLKVIVVVFGVFWLFTAKILVLDLVPLNLTLVI